ncbi:MAG: hypothetical protein GY796_30105, partial [Chloroflexi bacterium]|nr:hypothetical protein [Chloroflexota bacterium]
NSMWPFLREGDMVVVEHIQSHKLQNGDLLVVKRNANFITHRLVDKRDSVLVTKGDNRFGFDAPVVQSEILGKVIAIERGAEHIVMQKVVVCRVLGKLSWLEGVTHRLGKRVRHVNAGKWIAASLRAVGFSFRILLRGLVFLSTKVARPTKRGQ